MVFFSFEEFCLYELLLLIFCDSVVGSVRGFFTKAIAFGPVVFSVLVTLPWPSVSS